MLRIAWRLLHIVPEEFRCIPVCRAAGFNCTFQTVDLREMRREFSNPARVESASTFVPRSPRIMGVTFMPGAPMKAEQLSRWSCLFHLAIAILHQDAI